MTLTPAPVPEETARRRRAYTRPALQLHGRLADLTRVTGGIFGANDKVKAGNKTGL